jgi:prepilin-type N-terminal cleavage/methylation domain-containing protein
MILCACNDSCLRKRARSGFTLVEVMIVAALILIAVLGLWQSFTGALKLSVTARELTTAIDDARDMIVRLQTTSFGSLPALYPDGASVNPSDVGGFTLTNEQIVITYSGGTSGDVLNIVVTVSWTGVDGHNRSEEFMCMRARGL